MKTKGLFYGLVFSFILFLAMGNNVAADTSVSGIIDSDTSWTLAGSPYIAIGNVLVLEDVTLTIEPDVVVKFESGMTLQIDGTLIARGIAGNEITFTSAQSTPAAGDWRYILFSDRSTDATYDGDSNYLSGSILEYCTIEFAGAGNTYGLNIDSSAPFINRCIIQDNTGVGVYVDDGTPKITNNTITRNVGQNGGGIALFFGSPTLSGNIVTENTASGSGGGIFIYNTAFTATLSGNIVTKNTASGSGGGVYTTHSGTILSGNIVAENTASQDGGGICMTFGYCGDVTLSRNTITKNTASGNGDAVYFIAPNGTSVNVVQNTITDNNSSGAPSNTIYFQDTHNYGDIVFVLTNNNQFENDAQYLVYNGSANTAPAFNMENNWWGTTEEAEIQTKIYDWFDDPTKGIVDYTPWLTTHHPDAPISPPTGIMVTQIDTDSITISWDANPESDLAGYKVYWDTDSGHPYGNMVDVGNVTSYTITGLAPGTYYVTVTAYDYDYDPANDDPDTIVNENQTNGNESWYATEWTILVEMCKGDFDFDGDVDGSDLAIFAADFGRTDCFPQAVRTLISAGGLWHETSIDGKAGVWYYGQESAMNYDTGSANLGDLVFSFDLSGFTSAALNFETRWQTEPQVSYDVCQVFVSPDPRPIWELSSLHQSDWTTISVGLNSYAGDSDGRVVFHFDTVDENFNDYFGWAVYNIEVTGSTTYDCQGDFDADGDVDGSDLAIFVADFGRTDCPPCP